MTDAQPIQCTRDCREKQDLTDVNDGVPDRPQVHARDLQTKWEQRMALGAQRLLTGPRCLAQPDRRLLIFAADKEPQDDNWHVFLLGFNYPPLGCYATIPVA